jgi:hypothetical protein
VSYRRPTGQRGGHQVSRLIEASKSLAGSLPASTKAGHLLRDDHQTIAYFLPLDARHPRGVGRVTGAERNREAALRGWYIVAAAACPSPVSRLVSRRGKTRDDEGIKCERGRERRPFVIPPGSLDVRSRTRDLGASSVDDPDPRITRSGWAARHPPPAPPRPPPNGETRRF